VIRRRGFAEHLGLFEYRENAVRLAVIVAAAVEPLAAAVAAAAVVVVVAVVVLLVAAPEPAAVAAAAAAGTGVSSVPCGTVPIQDSDSKEVRLPCRQI
jgi:hypothetical protein